MIELHPEMYVGRYVECPSFLSGLKKIITSPQFLVKLSQHQVSQTSLCRSNKSLKESVVHLLD
jgi:hypothetical protein